MNSEGIRFITNRWKKGFSGEISQSIMAINANNLTLNSDETFLLWGNAFEYHRDKEKQAQLEAALGPIPFEFAKNIFLNLMVEKVDAISRLSKFIWDIEHASLGDATGNLGADFTTR
jgi:hypothetical protein